MSDCFDVYVGNRFRNRERERGIERQTDRMFTLRSANHLRNKDRQTDWPTDRQTDRMFTLPTSAIETDRQTDRQTDYLPCVPPTVSGIQKDLCAAPTRSRPSYHLCAWAAKIVLMYVCMYLCMYVCLALDQIWTHTLWTHTERNMYVQLPRASALHIILVLERQK
jgi:hypothetical protein